MCFGRIRNDSNGRLCFQTDSISGHVSYLNWTLLTDPTHIYLHGIRPGYLSLSLPDGHRLYIAPF